MGVPLEESAVGPYHRSLDFQSSGWYTRQWEVFPDRSCLIVPANRFSTDEMEGDRKRDGGNGCDGTSVSQHHAHLQPLECDADSASDRTAESAVVQNRVVGGHKTGHSHLNQLC